MNKKHNNKKPKKKGTGGRRRNRCRSYEAVQAFAMSRGIKTQKQWYKWCKTGARPRGVPGNPHVHFKALGQWRGWGHFLGTNNVRKGDIIFRSYAESRVLASSLGFTTQREWQEC